MHATAVLGLLASAVAVSAAPVELAQTRSTSSVQNLQDNIKTVVLLCMENRSLDNLLGGQTAEGLENPINNGPYCNPFNVSDPSQGTYCSQAKDDNSVKNDPSHAVTGNTMEFYGDWTPDNTQIAAGTLTADNQGFIHEHITEYPDTNSTLLASQVMNYYTEDQVPILTSLVQNFLTFNHWHSDIAGVSTLKKKKTFPC